MNRLSHSGDLTKWQRAVRMRYVALERAARDMANVPQEFLRACRSAEAFAKFENEAMKIEPIGSRNTLFKHADDLLSAFSEPNGCTGRQYLDSFRRRIYKAYISQQQKRRGLGASWISCAIGLVIWSTCFRARRKLCSRKARRMLRS